MRTAEAGIDRPGITHGKALMSQLEFYRTRAAEAKRDAEGATLDNVRDRCLRAEAAWASMAARAERGERMRAQIEERKEAEKALTAQFAE